MNTKNKIKDYSAILDQKYGKKGSKEREEFNQEALEFYASQIILHNRKEAKLTQQQLADKTGFDKSYISRIETGMIQPTVATFLKMIEAMGKRLEIK